MVEAKNLTKYYGRKKAVEGVSFKIEKGEVVGLLGPNAAGKTTLMKMLTCFLAPTSGTVSKKSLVIRYFNSTKNELPSFFKPMYIKTNSYLHIF